VSKGKKGKPCHKKEKGKEGGPRLIHSPPLFQPPITHTKGGKGERKKDHRGNHHLENSLHLARNDT